MRRLVFAATLLLLAATANAQQPDPIASGVGSIVLELNKFAAQIQMDQQRIAQLQRNLDAPARCEIGKPFLDKDGQGTITKGCKPDEAAAK